MKRCPECRKDYLDDSLMYCLDDGVALVRGSITDEPATAILSGGSGESSTRILSKDVGDRVTVSLPGFFARPIFPWMVALLLGVLLVTGWLYVRGRQTPSDDLALKFNISAPKDQVFGETIVISPDGRRIAFTLQGNSGEPELWVRPLDEIDPVKLGGTEGARFLFWSPDSKYIAFFASSKLKKIDANGGPPQTIADAGIEPRGGSWGRDGTVLFSPVTNSPIMRVGANGGPVTEATHLDTAAGEGSHRWPSFLPDGQHFLYFARGNVVDSQGVFVASLDGKEKKLLFNSRAAAIYAPPASGTGNGHLLYPRDNVLLAQAFDANKLELVGEPVTIVPSILNFPTEVGPTALGGVSVSDNGTLVFQSGSSAVTELRWADRSGQLSEPLANRGIYHEPAISPDGKHVAVSLEELGKGQDVWTLDLGRNVLSRLTFDPALDGSGLWSPDGSIVYFASNRAGNFAIYRKPATGVGNDELVYSAYPDNVFPDCVSPDGRWMLVDHGGGPGVRPTVDIVDLRSQERPQKFIASAGAVQHAQFSPDGKWVSYSSDESGRSEIYVQPFPATGGKWQISAGGGDQSQWNPNGKELFFMGMDRRLFSVAITPGTTFQAGTPTPLFATSVQTTSMLDERSNYAVADSGQRFLINGLVDSANGAPVTVFMNWERALKK